MASTSKTVETKSQAFTIVELLCGRFCHIGGQATQAKTTPKLHIRIYLTQGSPSEAFGRGGMQGDFR